VRLALKLKGLAELVSSLTIVTMRPANFHLSWCMSLLLLALLPPRITGGATAATTTKRRRKQQRHQSASITATKLTENNSNESLRERWVDILSLEDDSNSVRLDNQKERKYYYEAEILADKLLGINDDCDDDGNSSKRESSSERSSSPMISKELSKVWNAIAIASAGIIIGIPLASVFSTILTSNFMQSMLSSIQSSITPYLVPTLSAIASSLRNYRLQAQAILHSLPYFLKHLHRIELRPGPFLYKLLRKCIVLEAWRHIWLRAYKGTRYLWIGSLNKVKGAYNRNVPAFMKRGVKSMFQSMVQAYVHGYVGGVMGSVLGGVTFESLVWTSGSSGSLDSEGMGEAMSESLSDNAAQSLEATMQDAVNSVPVEETMDALTESAGSAVEDAVQDMAEDAVNAIADDAGFAMEDVVESISESLESSMMKDAMDSISESLESSMEDAMDSIAEDTMDALAGSVEDFMDDCLAEGCIVDEVLESVLE
jgi:hypothetical protein